MKPFVLPLLVLLSIPGCTSPDRTPAERLSPTGRASTAPTGQGAWLLEDVGSLQLLRGLAWASTDSALQQCARTASPPDRPAVQARRQSLAGAYLPGGPMDRLYASFAAIPGAFPHRALDSLQLTVACYSGEIVTYDAELTVYTRGKGQRSGYHHENGEWTQEPEQSRPAGGRPDWAVRTTHRPRTVTSRVWGMGAGLRSCKPQFLIHQARILRPFSGQIKFNAPFSEPLN